MLRLRPTNALPSALRAAFAQRAFAGAAVVAFFSSTARAERGAFFLGTPQQCEEYQQHNGEELKCVDLDTLFASSSTFQVLRYVLRKADDPSSLSSNGSPAAAPRGSLQPIDKMVVGLVAPSEVITTAAAALSLLVSNGSSKDLRILAGGGAGGCSAATELSLRYLRGLIEWTPPPHLSSSKFSALFNARAEFLGFSPRDMSDEDKTAFVHFPPLSSSAASRELAARVDEALSQVQGQHIDLTGCKHDRSLDSLQQDIAKEQTGHHSSLLQKFKDTLEAEAAIAALKKEVPY